MAVIRISTQNDYVVHGNTYGQVLSIVVDGCAGGQYAICTGRYWDSIQLNLNSFGSTGFSFRPSAKEGLYGPFDAGFSFSSPAVSTLTLAGFLEVKGILN